MPVYMMWGANTDVGKTLVSAGLAAATKRSNVRQRDSSVQAASQKTGTSVHSCACRGC